jgi:hypothetical protein
VMFAALKEEVQEDLVEMHDSTNPEGTGIG